MSIDDTPRNKWDTTDLDYYTNKQIHLMNNICDMKFEYANKEASVTYAQHVAWVLDKLDTSLSKYKQKLERCEVTEKITTQYEQESPGYKTAAYKGVISKSSWVVGDQLRLPPVHTPTVDIGKNQGARSTTSQIKQSQNIATVTISMKIHSLAMEQKQGKQEVLVAVKHIVCNQNIVSCNPERN